MDRVTVSTHVLDTAAGLPAAGVAVRLEGPGVERSLSTDADGRGRFEGELPTGTYRLTFEPGAHSPLFASVSLEVRLDEARHYHLPLLVSPYGLSTYRGS